MIRLLFCLIIIFIGKVTCSYAAATPSNDIMIQTGTAATSNIRPADAPPSSDYKKLTWKHKLKQRLTEWKLSIYEKYIDGEPTEKQRKQGRRSQNFGVVSLLILVLTMASVIPPVAMLLSLPIAIAGMDMGLRSVKGTKKNATGVTGIILNSVALLFWLLVIAAIAITLMYM